MERRRPPYRAAALRAAP